jgi:hypothetical protein
MQDVRSCALCCRCVSLPALHPAGRGRRICSPTACAPPRAATAAAAARTPAAPRPRRALRLGMGCVKGCVNLERVSRRNVAPAGQHFWSNLKSPWDCYIMLRGLSLVSPVARSDTHLLVHASAGSPASAEACSTAVAARTAALPASGRATSRRRCTDSACCRAACVMNGGSCKADQWCPTMHCRSAPKWPSSDNTGRYAPNDF